MTALTVEIDPRSADSRRAQRDSLAGPLEAGFEVAELPLDPAGTVALGPELPAASLFARLRAGLGDEEVTITVAVAPAEPEVSLTFERYTPAGAALLVRRRAALPPGGVALTLTAKRAGADIPPAEVARLLAVDAVTGNLGHLITLLSFEQQRIRRHLRAMAAARILAGANGALLDRVGADLGVPRFDDRPVFADGELNSVVREREADAGYRGRLAIFRGRIFPTPSEVLSRLRAIDPGFTLEERDNPYEVATRLVAVGADLAAAQGMLADAFRRLRTSQLLDPAAPDRDRAIPRAAQFQERALRDRLRAGLAGMPAVAALSPALARGLDRLLAFARAVGHAGDITLARAQDDAGGAPFELGLGAQLVVPATFAADLSAGIAAADPAAAGEFRPVVERLQPRIAVAPAHTLAVAELLEPLGFTTARMLSGVDLYVSPVPVGGIDIDGPGAVALAGGLGQATFAFRDLVPTTVGAVEALLAAAATEAGLAGAATDDAGVRAVLGTLPPHDPASRDRLLAARLSMADQPALGVALGGAEPDALAGWTVTGALAAGLRAGEADDWDRVSSLSFALADAGVPALAVLVRETGDVLLVASARPLPLLGPNLTQRKAVLTRWIVREAGGLTSRTDQARTGSGSRFELVSSRPELLAVSLVAYRRMGRTDPMEVRPELPPGTALGYDAYERMMNILAAACPAGVEINTWYIRQRHVRLDPAGPPAALPLSLARSFRSYRQRRFAAPSGASATSGDDYA